MLQTLALNLSQSIVYDSTFFSLKLEQMDDIVHISFLCNASQWTIVRFV